ncbi:MAG: hypothetical protein AAB285_09065, partial [candidate division NC10 bacterium]
MSKHGFRVLDSDLHVMEPGDLYERYLDPAFKHRTPRLLEASAGYLHHWQVDGYTFPRPLGRGRTESDARSRLVLRPLTVLINNGDDIIGEGSERPESSQGRWIFGLQYERPTWRVF